MTLKPEPVSIVSYLEDGMRRIYIFALGEDGHLYVNWWDGAVWRWADQGTPGVALTGQATAGVSAITYREGGKQRIYAFVTYGNLYVNYWDGNGWHWADQGRPSTQEPLVTRPSAVTYRDASNKQRIYSFVSSNSRLYVNYWDGTGSWHWADQGRPAGSELGRRQFTRSAHVFRRRRAAPVYLRDQLAGVAGQRPLIRKLVGRRHVALGRPGSAELAKPGN